MARLVGSYIEVFKISKEVAGSVNVRPARCPSCGIGIARPNGGATNREMQCPLCGSAIIQSTWGAKAVRGGYVVLSKKESEALARGEKIQVDRPLTPGLVRRMDIHDIYERVPDAPVAELAMLNYEIARRLG